MRGRITFYRDQNREKEKEKRVETEKQAHVHKIAIDYCCHIFLCI